MARGIRFYKTNTLPASPAADAVYYVRNSGTGVVTHYVTDASGNETEIAGGGGGSYIQTPSMTVANLASAATAGAGARAFVTDATATTFLSTVAGGGANKVPVVSDGTQWLIG